MSFETFAQEVASWPDLEVRKLQAYLVTLRHQRTSGTLERLAAKLDDPNTSRWVTLEDAEKSLGLDAE